MIGDLIKGEIWTETRARGEHRVKMKAEIHQGDASKKHQRLPTKPQKLGTGGGGGAGTDAPSQPQKESTCHHLDLGLPASRGENNTFLLLNHSICGLLLQQN